MRILHEKPYPLMASKVKEELVWAMSANLITIRGSWLLDRPIRHPREKKNTPIEGTKADREASLGLFRKTHSRSKVLSCKSIGFGISPRSYAD